MDVDVKRSTVSDGIYFTRIKSDKFKNNRISITLVAPLSEETAAKYAVLPLILRKGFRECPKAAQFARLLNSLYGASCDCNVRKAGDNQLLTLSVSAIDDKYTLGGESITAEISRILCSLLLDPVIENGMFSKKTFETEKQSLIDSIKAELNDKVALASQKCQQLMCEGHSSAISHLGSLMSAENLDCREVFDAYNTLLKKAHIEILFIGSGDADATEEIFTSSFSCSCEREKPYEIVSEFISPEEEIKNQTELYSISQAKLSLGFTCGGELSERERDAMTVMCVILGGAPFSKLFLNVREKLSLCYYCSSSFDRFKNTVVINSGIEAENRDKAQCEIINQLSLLQSGELSDDELENSRRLFRNIYTGISDSISRIEQYFLTRLIIGKEAAPDRELEAILSVTSDEVIAASKKLKLNTVYFMAPRGEVEK